MVIRDNFEKKQGTTLAKGPWIMGIFLIFLFILNLYDIILPNIFGFFTIIVLYTSLHETILSSIMTILLAIIYYLLGFMMPNIFLYPQTYLKFSYFLTSVANLITIAFIVHVKLNVQTNNKEKRSYACNRHSIEERDHCFFYDSDLMMVVFDTESGQIINANNAACKFFKYSYEEIVTKNILEINLLPKDQVFERIDRVKRGIEKNFIFKNRIGNGKIKLIKTYNKVIVQDDRELICCILYDVTDRKDAEQELRDSKERYKKLVQLSPSAIFVHNNGKFIFANKAAAKLFQVPHRKSLLGQPIEKFISKSYQNIIMKKMKDNSDGLTSFPLMEGKIATDNGNIVEVNVASNLIPFNGENAILTIMNDISERKERERLKERAEKNRRKINELLEYDRLRTEFFANISHELRTPINVILGALQLMELYEQDEEVNRTKLNKTVKSMKQNCYRLLRLINNLIDITKIDSGYFNLILENNDIVKIIEDITLSVAEYIENKGVKLVFDTNIEEKVMACDPDKIERIIMNLLSNALKFTKKGDEIEVSIYDDTNKLIISVKDTGIGIPQEQQKLIFDRFRQVDRSLARSHEGSGIGLSLVKSLVEMHGGRIFVKSQYGHGSEFIIELPVNILKQEEVMECTLNYHSDNEDMHKKYAERIHIEFSDIYS